MGYGIVMGGTMHAMWIWTVHNGAVNMCIRRAWRILVLPTRNQ